MQGAKTHGIMIGNRNVMLASPRGCVTHV
jgi:hypothetical protein